MDKEHQRISQIGLAARSPEGHAAKGMHIKGNEDLWVEIQANTFRNWVNENLKPVGLSVRDLATDFCDGVKLVSLIEALQKRKLKKITKPVNQHQFLENVTTALNAISADGIKLVNIGNVDIVNGNLKLILGLIWSLIVHYQIGRSKFPPKKLMLAWLKAVLPECRVHNFTTDWNSGLNLGALLDYCRPGLMPEWRGLDPQDSVENCHNAMYIAQKEFQIPMVLEPEYLASPYLDELSGMTYLSYFMKENSPGYKATLNWVRQQIPASDIRNFTTDWNDGLAVTTLVRSLGGPIPGYNQLLRDQPNWISNLELGIKGGQKLGVQPVLSAKDMADPNVEHLGVMAYVASYQWVPKRKRPGERLAVDCDTEDIRVNQPSHFKIEFLSSDVNLKDIRVEVQGPSGTVDCRLNLTPTGGTGIFTPTQVGMHQLNVYCEEESVKGCPVNIRVLPDLSKIMFAGIDPCAIGSIVEVLINSNGAGGGIIDVTAVSPTERSMKCPVSVEDGVYTATFQPDEAGGWKIAVTYDTEHIQGSPFTCFVFDPNGVKLVDLDGAIPGEKFSFICDATKTGWGDVKLDIVHNGRSLPHRMIEESKDLYRISFTPQEKGKHRVYVYFNGNEIKGSPFSLRVGYEKSSPRVGYKKSSPLMGIDNTSVRSKMENSAAKIETSKLDMEKSQRFGFDQTSHSHSLGIETTSPSRVTNNVETFPPIRVTVDKNVTSPNSTYTFGTEREAARHSVDMHQDRSHYQTSTTEHISDRRYSSERTANQDRSYSPFERSKTPEVRYPSLERSTPSPRRVSGDRNGHSSPLVDVSHQGYRTSVNVVGDRRQTADTVERRLQTEMHDRRLSSEAPQHRRLSHLSDERKYSSLERNLQKKRQSLESETELARRGSINVVDSYRGPEVDTGSNVKVSNIINVSSRRDSWDAINKTKGLLSYGSVDSVNKTEQQNESSRRDSSMSRAVQGENQTHTVKIVSSYDEVDAIHDRLSSGGALGPLSSPHKVRAVGSSLEAADVVVSGDGIKLVPVDRMATFAISGRRLESADVDVQIRAPSKDIVPFQMVENPGGSISINYFATEVGEHLVDVRVHNRQVHGAPFRCYAYNAKEIKVGEIPNGVVGKPVEFEIDGSRAGSGNLEILVNGGHVTSYVRNLGNQRFLASFVPHSAMVHTVDMKFNGETIPGSPWQANIMDPSIPAKVSVVGEGVRHFAAGKTASFEVSTAGFSRDDVNVNIVSPNKMPIPYQLVEESGGICRMEFTTAEVGSYIIDVLVGGQKISGSPFIAKAYDSSLIRVSDVGSGVVGQPCQFRVDASQAGEGQLEISINDGEVPNHVQVLGGGKCLVSFTPEQAKPHIIDIKFNGETAPGCPFTCNVADTSRVSVSLHNLELMPVNKLAKFHITVDGGGDAELAVSVRGPSNDLPVKVAGNVRSGFTAEFTPTEVGAHTIQVELNGLPVGGTPFTAKAYDSEKVYVSPVPKGSIGKNLQFTVDASQAGEGNLEITISVRGRNIPTQVHPQGSAKFAVSFTPLEAINHGISITFNKEPVPGSPFTAQIHTDPNHIVVSGQSLASTAVGKTSYFTLSNVTGSVEDIEVNVEGPTGLSVPAQVVDNGDQTFHVEFSPRNAGEHKIHISYSGDPVPGSPFSCKVYDVMAIKVRETSKGVVGKPVTFLVETSQAGPGNLEVTVNNGQVPTSAEAQGNHTYAISFTPKEAKPHIVELKFNGENVAGSPFKCYVVDATRVSVTGEGLEKVPLNHLATFFIEAQALAGEPEVKILSPTRRPVSCTVRTQADGQYAVDYTPMDVGDHSVEVKFSDLQIQGSPFLVKAYDATKVQVTDISNGVVGKPVYFSIDASQAGAGNLEIIVSVNGKNVPNYVQSEGNAKFRVNFKPQESAVHTLSVKFNGEAVPGSPFSCKIADSSQIIVSGSALKMSSLTKTAVFSIDPQGADISDCLVTVLSPAGQNLPVQLSGSASTKFTAGFSPLEVGPHTVSVIIDNEPVGGSPFTCNIYDVSKVNVTGLGTTKVGKPVTFTVDASQAGEGTLELVVTTAKASVRAEVTARSRGLYDVTFVPQEAICHFVNITFNEEDVPGNPFKCDIKDLDAREIRHIQRTESKMVTAKGEGLKHVVAGSTAFFDIDPKGMEGEVEIRITGPSGKRVPSRLLQMKNGLYRAEYSADMVGTYQIEVLHEKQAISKQPYLVDVYSPDKVRVINVAEAFAGKECTFRVDASSAGQGGLSVTVRAAGQDVKHSIRDISGGQYEVLYYPKVAIPHKIDIKYNDMHVSGCPFEVLVKNPALGKDMTATGIGLHQSWVGKVTSFVIETLGHSGRDFDVIITGPQDSAVPVKCYQQKDGNLLAEFTAQNAGTFKIEVLHENKPVKGSPFFCQVYDATRVTIEDVKNTTVAVGEKISFRLDRSEAGFAELDVTVTSPLGKNLPIEVKGMPDREGDLIEFFPSVPGKYRFAITYGGEEVPGSPVTFQVEEDCTARVSGDGLYVGQVDTPVTFKLDAQGVAGEPQIQVDGPDSVAKTSIDLEEDGVYIITYTPQEVGIFDVRVWWNGKEIPGSPFHPKVVNVRKVRVIGGWESLMDDQGRIELSLHEERKINFDVAEAGPGKLTAEIHGPSANLDFGMEQNSVGRYRLIFTPQEEGEHMLYLYWADFPIPKSPFLAYTEPVTSPLDHMRVVLTGKGLAGAHSGEESEFIIDGSKAGPGSPEVTMSGVKTDIKVHLHRIRHNVYRAVYTPSMSGAYLLNVTWSERQVKGCPLKVNVTSVSDASKVLCSGDGLKAGTIGKEIKSFIDTRRAGPGELTAHCMGPHNKTAYCELYDHQDGTFTLNIKPQEPGRHALTIKYGGEHVPGSAFTLRVAGAPDPSKVRVYGPGVEHGVLAAFQSRFICDTRGAGAGQLTVRIRGPKGAFRVEMQRESQKDRTILCKYDPTEPGDYRVEIKWSGEHVPGSPFMVMIFDTQEELSRFLQGGYSPKTSGSGVNADLYGSLRYSTAYGHMNFGQMSWKGSQPQL